MSDDASRNLVVTDQIVLVDVGGAGGVHPKWSRLSNRLMPILFEPNPVEAAKLRVNLKQNFNSSIVIEYGLSNENGIEDLNIANYWGCSSLRSPNPNILSRYRIGHLFKIIKTQPVTCVRFDSLFYEGRVAQPDIIKIDVQGFEYEVLQGFGGLLQDCLAIELEAHFYQLYQGQKLFHDLVSMLSDYGFVLRKISPVPSFDGDVVEVDAWFTKDIGIWRGLNERNKIKFSLICEVCELIDYNRIDPLAPHSQIATASSFRHGI